MIDHTNADGNTLRVTLIQAVTNWLEYAANVRDSLEDMLETSDENKRAEIHSAISELYYKAQAWQNKKTVAEHGLHAYRLLEELKHFNASKSAWVMPPVHENPTHDLFVKGTTTSNQKSLRLLIQVDLLYSMLRSGALEQKGVRFNLGRFEGKDNEVYFIKRGEYTPIRFAAITHGPNGFFKTLELSDKFETVIERYSLMNIPRATDHEKTDFLKKFADVVEAEKRMQLINNLFPHALPWKVIDVWTMPVVIWIRKG